MTARERSRIGKYISELAGLMGLRDWTFSINKEPADADALASILIPFGQRFGVLYLGARWAEYTPELKRATLVHELMHCHLEGLWSSTQKAIEALLDEGPGTALVEVMRYDVERAIDDVAMAWSEKLPLP